MERRAFLKNTTKAALLIPILPGYLSADSTLTYDPEDFFQQLVAANDRQVTLLLARQLQRPGERFDGDLPDAHEIATAMGTAIMVQHLVSAYIAPTSAYHASQNLQNSLDQAIAFLLRTQHADGTIDLLSANFHSTPDTAFVVIGNTYVMNWELTKSYYQPYPEAEIPGDGKWGRLSRAKRTQSEVQHLRCRVEIKEMGGGFEVRIQIDGTAHVPVSVEMAFRKGGTLNGISTVDGNPDAFLLIPVFIPLGRQRHPSTLSGRHDRRCPQDFPPHAEKLRSRHIPRRG